MAMQYGIQPETWTPA